MPLSKRNFQKAKMNKDADERLIPQGHYRDALNIQVSTSDGSNAGSAQTLLGNTASSTMLAGHSINVPTTATCVGAVAAKDSDKIYYFVSAGDEAASSNHRPVRKDYILEYDSVLDKHRYVFVDIYRSTITTVATTSSTSAFVSLAASSATNDTGIRLDMIVTGTVNGVTYTRADALKVSEIKYNANLGSPKWDVYLTHPNGVAFSSSSGVVSLSFHADRVLNFSKNIIITGINVLDEFIYWTDNSSEPKKISIPRSIAGTGGTDYLYGAGNGGWSNASTVNTSSVFEGDFDHFHTRLVKDKAFYNVDSNRYSVVTNASGNKAVYVNESHITVIKKAPTQPLEIEMFRGPSSRVTDAGVENKLSTTCSFDVGGLEVGNTIDVDFDEAVDFRVGDVLLLAMQTSAAVNSDTLTFEPSDYDIRALVTASDVLDANALSSTGFVLKIRTISNSISDLESQDLEDLGFVARLEVSETLFNLKFPRFSYRYKYQDGEYSTFAPWSQVAFLPDHYDFKPAKGFNLGMANQVKSVKLKGYHASEAAIPQDIVEIDLLYKETNNPTVYTVKTLRKSDGFDNGIWPDLSSNANARGEFVLDTDLIHAVVPSNQLIRPWDNVPRKALAQEISANRVVYGNYLQNYTILKDPVIDVGLHVDGLHYAGIGWGGGFALPSVKTSREYQVGVVFSDEYGRETPVLSSKKSSISVPKDASKRRNRITASLSEDTVVPDWAKHYSFYIKETSTGYHNMTMDRWYHAEDGNIWLSFPSSERNKVDLDTFLSLKKAHNSDQVVEDKTKYKVLALENEAPPDVKSFNKSLGSLFCGEAGSVIGINGNGYPLQDTTFITVDGGSFDSAFGSDFATPNGSNMFITFTGQGKASKPYGVASITQQEANKKIQIIGRFGGDVAFASSDDTIDNTINDLSFLLFEREPRDTPEFDGRFFVKINRDESIDQQIIQYESSDYTVETSWPLRYINSNAWFDHPSGWSVGNSHTQAMMSPDIDNTSQNRSKHPTAQDLNTAQRYWGGNSAVNGQNQSSNGNITADYYNQHPDILTNGTDPSVKFWENMADHHHFFIDACTAYSWSGRGNANGDMRPGNILSQNATVMASGGNVYTYTDFYDTGGVAEEQSDGAVDGITGNMNPIPSQRLAHPSRGIWGWDDGQRYMDISWTGMSKGYDGNNFNSGKPFPAKLSQIPSTDGGGIYAEANSFIKKLVAPGTKFRFQRDPDGIVYTVQAYNWYQGYNNPYYYNPDIGGNPASDGAWGIRNYRTGSPHRDKKQYRGDNLRQRWTIQVDPPIGDGGTYKPTRGNDSVDALRHDGSDSDVIEILGPVEGIGNDDSFSENPAIWETEPKESVDLDIYYQATGLIPVELNEKTNEEYLPIGTKFKSHEGDPSSPTIHTITNWTGPQTFTFTPAISPQEEDSNPITANSTVVFDKRNSYSLTAVVKSAVGAGASSMTLWGGPETTLASRKLYSQKHRLDWSNCYSFGNGLESDTVRDSFNGAKLDNGVKASTVLGTQSREERRKNGMIWSGIYNSSAGVNNTNQFIAGENITKDVNPSHGSIQRLFNRGTTLAIFCEDKVLQAVTNKDALYSADGKPQLVASNAVVGDVTAYQGDWGISKNPESLAVTPGNLYFTDIIRGQVLALSNEGVRSISNAGMKDYFADLSKSYVWRSLGTYDERKNEYNVTISKKYASYQIQPHEQTTISYSEIAKGWASFKSFNPQNGVSLNNDYFTFSSGRIWKHHTNETRNKFYGNQYTSNVTLVFNDAVEAAKSIGSINYEGTQARITNFDLVSTQRLTGDIDTGDGLATAANIADGEYFNIEDDVPGWYVESIVTNLQTCGELEFKDKEGKWFGIPSGEATSLSNIDGKEFSVQGLGTATVDRDDTQKETFNLTVSNNTSTTYEGSDGGGGAWDSTAD